MKNKRDISMTGKEVIIAMIIFIIVFTVMLIITINNWLNPLSAIYIFIIILLLFASGLGSIITAEIFIIGLIGNAIINKTLKKSKEIVNNRLSTEYSSVRLRDNSNLKYFIKDDDIKCEAKLGNDGTIDLKIKIDAKVVSDTLTFTDNFDIL